MQVVVSALSSNFGLIRFTVLEIEQFSYFGILAWNCSFTPTFRGFWGIFSPNDVIYRCDPKRHFLARKHVVWAIKRENWSTGSTWAQDREKKESTGQDRTGQHSQKKSQRRFKALHFTYLGRSPHWTDFYKNLHSSCLPRRNHVCKLLSWNFEGLRFYRGRISPFPIDYFMGLTTVQRYCAACDTCMCFVVGLSSVDDFRGFTRQTKLQTNRQINTET